MKRVSLMLAGVLALTGLVSAEGRVKVDVNGNVLVAQAGEDVAGAQVTVTGPGGFALQRSFAGGEAVALSLADRDGTSLQDGQYNFEVVWSPRAVLARGAAESAGSEATAQGPRTSGTFRVSAGQAALPVPAAEPARSSRRAAGSDAPVPPMPDDQVIPDDLIVQGSTCVGLDCVNNENFGFDTIRLKENNTRINFDDTSASAGFPANDWELTANDSASGGQSQFSILDRTSSKVPFKVVAGAPTGSIHVDSTGRVGLRTTTPVLDLHVATGNTPAMRLEQNGSGGFTAQTWDIAGNEANFFVRDVTGGSRLPFRIRPGAPTSSVDISTTGNVGIGHASPTTALHVKRTDGTAKLLVEEGNATADRVLMQLQNSAPNSKSRFLIQSGTGADGIWTFDNNGQSLNTFSIVKVASGTTAFTLNANGNLTIAGTLTQNSDRDTKDGIQEVDAREVLAKVSELPISTWHYKTDDAEVTHLGPMAQDFAAAFGLGQDDRHIAPVDMGGVALAAIKALHQAVEAKDARIQALEAQLVQLKRLEERLAQLEAAQNP